MSNICQRYIRRHCEEKNGGSYMKLLNTLSTDLEEMLTELYEDRNMARNATFLEPHLQGIRRRDSRSSDSDHDERSTEDDERSLLRSSPRTRLPPPPPPPPDDEPPPLKPREFFERLQTQAMREAQDRKHRSRDLSLKDNQLFRPVDAEGSLGDSLSQKCDIPRAASARHKETRQQEFRL
ncbi:uncharacterized protein LOC113495609 isoform X3 [Trichoplusia ni]|uniref:Uncharacterized protein LOC113495609 isoform X3 n=1 Tax=Trichoplusia ni TaxID=7111 RepID=A0A7E5VPH5_TRINI|nr:uncharacterized protein LOC113495609 isoform X3 [Trichoplusia ni]